jgi:hypothetical protein
VLHVDGAFDEGKNCNRSPQAPFVWHTAEVVGDLYSKLEDDVAFRQEAAKRIGLGFEVVHKSSQNAAAVSVAR